MPSKAHGKWQQDGCRGSCGPPSGSASSGITAAYQTMGHPACDFARAHTIASLAATGAHLSDGATNVLSVGPHRGEGLTEKQIAGAEALKTGLTPEEIRSRPFYKILTSRRAS